MIDADDAANEAMGIREDAAREADAFRRKGWGPEYDEEDEGHVCEAKRCDREGTEQMADGSWWCSLHGENAP